MTHKKYKELLILQVYNELGSNEQKELDEHLRICKECKNEKENLKKFKGSIPNTMSFNEDEDLITESRRNLRNAIRMKRNKKSVWEVILDFWKYSFSIKYKFALGGISTLALGFFIGYLAFFQKSNINISEAEFQTIGKTVIYGAPQINGMKFIKTDDQSGEVEFTFDETIPMHVKGKMDEPRIQKLLAKALVNEQNPGVRLKTVNMVAENQKGKTDDELKKSLINALKYDNNPGVRKEAIRVLRNLPFDNEIKDAFLFVLMNDKNSGMRIAAINCLGEAKGFEKTTDTKILNVLREKERMDDNDYIRIRAKSLLQEVKQ
jgi:hypothetical protein